MNPAPSLSRIGVVLARRILTLASAAVADATWWENGSIVAVGSAAELERRAPRSTPRFEFPDALVTPGFMDVHTYFAL